MVLRPHVAGLSRSLLLAGFVFALCAFGCLGTTPPQRLATATPIALVVKLESAAGVAIEVPARVQHELAATLAARNLQAEPVPVGAIGDVRTSQERVAALLRATAAAGTAPWVLLVEARARFFSLLSGRYRWEVELRTSLVPRERPDAMQVSDLSVAAFLQFEHQGEAEALDFVRRQLIEDLAALVDRVLADVGAVRP